MTTPRVAGRSVHPTGRRTASDYSLAELLSVQKAAYQRDGIPDAPTRIDRINRLQALVLDNADELVAALAEDFGTRPREVSVLSDIVGCLTDTDYQKKHLRSWMKPGKPSPLLRAVGFGQAVRHDPLGVVGVIGPWNFPLQLTIVPAGSALGAGNRVLLRPSEITAATARTLARHAPDYFTVEEFAVVTDEHGDGADFARLELDHLFFTGSPSVGAQVASAAGANLVPVTLELGGKNPVVVDVAADLDKAARRVAGSRMVNGGQVCLCPDYVFVPRAMADSFCDKVIATWRGAYPSVIDNAHYTSVINDRHYARVVGLINDAAARGATVHQVVPAGESLPDASTRKIAPTLLREVPEDSVIASQEVFGPVLSVYAYDDISEPITYINARPHPLSIYWYGPRNERFEQVQASTRSGSVNGNDFSLNMLGHKLPFGGVGRSGMGAYHGKFGFDTFSHARTVTHSRLPLVIAEMMSPPFTSKETRRADKELRKGIKRIPRTSRRPHAGSTRTRLPK